MKKENMTRILMTINILVFIIMTVSGGTRSTNNLIRFGAMAKPLVAGGQWWRVFTASFIHIGFFHIAMNMYFLYSLGPVFESLYGSGRFLLIYLVSGVMGNLMSYAFSSPYTVSAGASTSLYGLLGLALGMMQNYRDDHILRSFGASFLSIIAINVIYSILSPSVGIWGHFGGFLAGFILSGIIPVLYKDLPMKTKILNLIFLIAFFLSFIQVGNRSMGEIIQ